MRTCSDHELIPYARELAHAIFPLPLEIDDGSYWIETARDILTGAIVFLFHQGASFIEAMKVILSTSLDRLLMYISKDEDAAACLDTNITKADKTAAVIRSEICRNITVFTSDKIVQEALTPSEDGSRTPICWSDLEHEDIFVRMDLSRMGQLDKLLRMITVQLIRTLQRRPEKYLRESKDILPTLLLLDEFPQYGRDTRRTIMDNCPYQVILSASDSETQDYFSKRTGLVWIGVESATETYGADAVQTGYSISLSQQAVPAIAPHEFGYLQDVVLLHPGLGGYLVLKKSTAFRTDPPETIPESGDDDEQIPA